MADVEMAAPVIDSNSNHTASISVSLPPEITIQSLLSTFQSLPENLTPSIQVTEQLLLNPTEPLIQSLYKALINLPNLVQASKDLEKERSERVSREIEIETSLNQAERLRAEANERSKREREEREQLEKQKSELNGKVSSLETELSALKSTSETGLTQTAEFKGRLEGVEQEKRDLLSKIEREKTECNRRGDEIEALSTSNKELRQSESRLTTELQEARSAEGLSKFKIQSLEQELALARKDAEWAHNELANATNSASQFRSTSHSQIVKLQSELDAANQTNSSLTSKVNSLQSAYDSCISRLNESNDKLTELQNRFTLAEESFRTEISTQQRLNALLERRAEDSQKRVDEIEAQWEDVLVQCREREETAREETLQEKSRSERLEKEKNELQIALDRLAEGTAVDIQRDGLGRNGNDDVGNSSNGSAPGTPLRGSNHLPNATQLMSPTAALAGKVQRSGMSFTQIYANLARTEEELRRERAEKARLDQVLADITADLEDRAPLLQEIREENERISLELEEMSSHFARACQEKDEAERASENRRLELQKATRENGIISQQLADLGRQVRNLLREITIRDDPSSADRLEPDGTELPDPTLGGEGNQDEEDETQAIITSQLVTFSSLTDLCAQNARLLRVTRELGSRMEKEEEDYKARLARNESEAVQEATKMIQRLQEALRSEKNINESLKREKDMFRSMASTGRARTISGSGVGAQSPGNGNASGLFGASGNSEDFNARQQELARSYTQLQNQFDAFKTETATDTERLKNDVFEARREAGQATIAAARERGAKENAEERLLTLQGTFELQKKELNEIIKQKNALQNNLTRRDLSFHEIEEQLQKTRSQLEILRNESANLRAEKEIFKSTENRLLMEKKTLEDEKRSLNDFLKNMQNMSNEIEKENSINKRRLENQVNNLEESQKTLKLKLARAEDSLSEISLRKEVEVKDLQNRLDKLNSELSNVKEQFAISKTNETHLKTKIEELNKSLDTKEEKLSVYERRVANAAAINASASGSGNNGGENDALSREQTLEIELADLRGDLRAAQVEAEQARGHTEQFKSIAQSVEDALNELKTSSDTYREEMERERTEKEAEIQSLRSRLEAVASELTAAQNESSQLRQEVESQRSAFASEKRSLEDALAEMNGVEDRVNAAQADIKNDLKRQIQLTKEAHDKYEAELVAHAEDVKKLSTAKENLSKKDSTIRELTIQSETAVANLTNSEASWKGQKENLEKEIGELGRRIEDLTSQNAILHSHLETASSQANQIRQAASETQGAADGDTSMSGSQNEELHEVIKYLRREKEIAELQIDVNKQESARLRQSLEHANHSLDEVRTTLAEERSRNAGAASSAEQHAALLEKINQVSILRESNVTLREEAERSQSRANRLDELLSTTQAQIEPLKDQLRNLNVELEASQAQVKLLQEDNTRWQARAQSILQQYNRIDPEELKALEERAKSAESARDSIRAEMQTLLDQANASQESNRAEMQGQIDTAQAGKTASEERFQKLQQQIRERLRAKDEAAAKLQGEKDGLEKELTALRDQQTQDQASLSTEVQNQENKMAELRAERDRAIEEKAQAEKSLEANQSKIQGLEEQLKAAQSQAETVSTSAGEVADASANNQALETAKAAWEQEKKTLQEMTSKHHQKAKEFLKNQKEAEAARDAALAKLAQVEQAQPQIASSSSSDPDSSSTVQALQQRVKELEEALTKANATIEELQAKLAASPSNGGNPASDEIEQLKKDHEAALQAQESNLSERFTKQQKQAIEIAVNRYKTSHAAESPEARQAAIDAAVQAAVESKKKEWEDSISARLAESNEQGKKESDLRNKLSVAKKDKEIQKLNDQLQALRGNSATTATATSTPASTPVPAGGATTATPVRPTPISVRGRGGATSSPTVSRPVASALNNLPANPVAASTAVRGSSTSIRGRGSGIATRGGRGGAAVAAAAAAAAGTAEGSVGQKRKAEGNQGTNAAGGAAKRGRPAVNKPGGN